MPDASHTPSICACTRGCDSSLGVGGLLGSGEGVGKKQAPEAMFFFLFALPAFVWVGLGCVCSSPLGKQHFHHCMARDRCPAIQDKLSRTLANRPPLAKISSCARPPPPRRRPGPIAAALPLAMPRVRVTIGVGSMAPIAATHEGFGQEQQDSGGRGRNGSRAEWA